MERKIEIYNFSARTRQLFIRLLALVKWANSASKVYKSSVRIAYDFAANNTLRNESTYIFIVIAAHHELFGQTIHAVR